jgi:hypothetical protein
VSRLILVGVAVAITATSCILPDFRGNPDGPRLAVIGDSITAGSETAVRAATQDAYYTSVTAEPGYTSSQMVTIARNYDPPVAHVVVEAGANDWPSGDVGAVFDNLRTIRSHFTGECITVATIPQHTSIPALNQFAAAFNFYLLFSGEWSSILDLDAITADWSHTTDTLHLNESGQALFAERLRAAVDTCLP